MHDDSYTIMAHLVRSYLQPAQPLNVLDVGSYNVNGTYRSLFAQPTWSYVGADIQAGPNVDIVLHDPYHWEIPDASYDLVISGQAFEHIEFFWLTWMEMVRTLRPGGLIFLVAPSAGREHRFPVDCWRFYRDSMHALAKYGDLQLLAAETCTTFWGDTVGVFRKPTADSMADELLHQPAALGLPTHLTAPRPAPQQSAHRLCGWLRRTSPGLIQWLATLRKQHCSISRHSNERREDDHAK